MKSHAEVAEVWPRDGLVRLVGHIYGRPVRDEDEWRLLLVLRCGEQRLHYQVALEENRFESELPITDLRKADPASVEEWDLHLTEGTAELRVGRHLDDIRGKKRIMVYPEQRLADFSVRPYFTVNDNLSLECRTEVAS
ncbi:hypothetical protein [Streptomyces cavernae]|uniref:hypothetical protein n=1 Tax=Streptomyces cavernae TaxID=2259034 RepID=UPI000FEB86DC|nr:hypothetical protein [Streptomyces cavernae]